MESVSVYLSKNYIKSKLSSRLPNNSVSRLQYREVGEFLIFFIREFL